MMNRIYNWMNNGHREYKFLRNGKEHTLTIRQNGYFDTDYVVKSEDHHYTPTPNELIDILECKTLKPVDKYGRVL